MSPGISILYAHDLRSALPHTFLPLLPYPPPRGGNRDMTSPSLSLVFLPFRWVIFVPFIKTVTWLNCFSRAVSYFEVSLCKRSSTAKASIVISFSPVIALIVAKNFILTIVVASPEQIQNSSLCLP